MRSSPDIIRVIQSTKMRWAGHVACRYNGIMFDTASFFRLFAMQPFTTSIVFFPKRRCNYKSFLLTRALGAHYINFRFVILYGKCIIVPNCPLYL
jgi:hypothetical protein